MERIIQEEGTMPTSQLTKSQFLRIMCGLNTGRYYSSQVRGATGLFGFQLLIDDAILALRAAVDPEKGGQLISDRLDLSVHEELIRKQIAKEQADDAKQRLQEAVDARVAEQRSALADQLTNPSREHACSQW